MLLSDLSILNTVDFNLRSYSINKTKKKDVSILGSTVEDISKTTEIDEDLIKIIQNAAHNITGLRTYDQIKDAVEKDETISKLIKPRVYNAINKLSKPNNHVTINKK